MENRFDDTVHSIALDIKVVYAFNKSYDDSHAENKPPLKGQQPLLRALKGQQQLRYLASSGHSHAMCCTAQAINSPKAPQSKACKNSQKCSKKPQKPKNQKQRLLSVSPCEDSSETQFNSFVTECMPFEPCSGGKLCSRRPRLDPEETRCILNAESTEDVAACAVSRYIEDNLDPGSFQCSRYNRFDCADNEDISFEQREGKRCTDDTTKSGDSDEDPNITSSSGVCESGDNSDCKKNKIQICHYSQGNKIYREKCVTENQAKKYLELGKDYCGKCH